jgi:chromosome segregation ATPase
VIRHNAIKEELERSEQALESCQEKLRAAQLEIQQYQQQTSDLSESILALEQEVYRLKNSRIWKLTASLRKLKDG